jgi:hypothetical protein
LNGRLLILITGVIFFLKPIQKYRAGIPFKFYFLLKKKISSTDRMLTDVEQIIASRWIWKWLETYSTFLLTDKNLRFIANEAGYSDGKTEYSLKRITKYLNNLLTDEYKKWALAKSGERKELLVKQQSNKL